MANIKYYIRRNKLLSSFLKPIYRFCVDIKNIPIQKKAYQETLNSLSSVKKASKKIWYFGVPTHANLGDQAQKYCINSWLSENYVDYKIIRISSNAFNYQKNKLLATIITKVGQQDLMVMQSGYTIDGLHPDEQSHRLIAINFPNNKIVYFPQTILYKKNQAMMSKAIDSHKSTLLLARDRVSYESAKKYYPSIRIELFPDIVTTLIGSQLYTESNRSGILVCVRNDGEKLYSDSDISGLVEKIGKYGTIDITDTNAMNPNSISNDSELFTDILKTVKRYSKYRVIITDRYHGTIFSLIACTPVIVLKTTDHKVITGAEWFKGIYDDYVFRTESLDDVVSILETIMGKSYQYKLKPYFKEMYYDKLKSLIDFHNDN